MTKGVALLGAPSNLGLKPHSDGHLRGVDQAPRIFRERGLVERIAARDLGDRFGIRRRSAWS